jgi:hypothetical protein
VERPQEAVERKFLKKETVNGIEISVGWDEGYEDYTIYLPQVQTDYEKGISDQVVRIGESTEAAERVFEKAKELAAASSTPEELYLKMEKYIREHEWE